MLLRKKIANNPNCITNLHQVEMNVVIGISASVVDSLKECLKQIQEEKTKRPVFKAMLSHLFPTLTGLVYTANLVQGGLYGLNKNFSIPSTTQDSTYTQLAQESHLIGFVINTLGTLLVLSGLFTKELHSKNAAFIGKTLQLDRQKFILPFLLASATNLAIEISLMARTEYKVHDDFLNDPKRLALVMTVVNAFALLSATIGTLLNYLKPEGPLLPFMPMRYQQGLTLSRKISELIDPDQASTEETQIQDFMRNLQNVSKEGISTLLEAYLKGLTVSIGKEAYTLPQTQLIIEQNVNLNTEDFFLTEQKEKLKEKTSETPERKASFLNPVSSPSRIDAEASTTEVNSVTPKDPKDTLTEEIKTNSEQNDTKINLRTTFSRRSGYSPFE